MGGKVGWPKGKPLPEEMKRKISESQKGHIQTFYGVKIDADIFMKNYVKWSIGELSINKFGKIVGLRKPPLMKRINMLEENGVIDGIYFTDGQPVYADWSGIKPGIIARPKPTRKKPRKMKR